QILQLERDLAEVCLHAESARTHRLHVPLEALPPDVCGNGNLNRQRAQKEVEELGTLDRAAMQEAVPGKPHAGAAIASLGYRISRTRTAHTGVSDQEAAGRSRSTRRHPVTPEIICALAPAAQARPSPSADPSTPPLSDAGPAAGRPGDT